MVGTKGDGVFWVSPEGEVTGLSTNGVFTVGSTNVRTVVSTEARLSHSWVLSVVVDREGFTVPADGIDVDTDGGGLYRVKRQSFEMLDKVDGWSVHSVTEDEGGGLWIGSNRDGLGYWTNGILRPFYAGAIKAVFADRDG